MSQRRPPLKWKPYDPTWLVALAKTQHPDEPWLAAALAACVQTCKEGRLYVQFVDSTAANQPGAPWQFDRSIWLNDPVVGDLNVDVLKDGRIGGFEFFSRLFRRRKK